jgi:hypothetical protein
MLVNRRCSTAHRPDDKNHISDEQERSIRQRKQDDPGESDSVSLQMKHETKGEDTDRYDCLHILKLSTAIKIGLKERAPLWKSAFEAVPNCSREQDLRSFSAFHMLCSRNYGENPTHILVSKCLWSCLPTRICVGKAPVYC